MSLPLESSPLRETPVIKPRRVGHTRSDLKSSVVDAGGFSFMVGAGESYLPAFALALGLGELRTGLLATLPQLLGSVLQLAAPRAVERLRSHRRWVLGCVFLQALCFVPLVGAALLGSMPAAALFAVVASYWALGQAAGTAWNVWIERLVPRRLRPTYFARRARVAQVCTLVGLFGAGFALDRFASHGLVLAGFALIFAAAAIARIVSAASLVAQSEPPLPPIEHRRLPVREVLRRLASGPGGKLVTYVLCLQVAVSFASPFFNPFMLQKLELSYSLYMALVATSFLGRFIALPALGRVAHRFGPGHLLWLGGLGIAPLSVMWLVSDNFYYLIVAQLMSGAAWAAYDLGVQLLYFKLMPRSERMSLLTLHNLLNALALVSGSVMGGSLLQGLGGDTHAYHVVFALSSLGRLLALVVLVRVVPWPRPRLAGAEVS